MDPQIRISVDQDKPVKKGFITIFSLSIVIAMTITFVSLFYIMKLHSKQEQAFMWESRALTTAVTGSNRTVGLIMLDTKLENLDRMYPGLPAGAECCDPSTGPCVPAWAECGVADPEGFYSITRGDVLDDNGKTLGHYVSKARKSGEYAGVFEDYPDESETVYHVVTTGWPYTPHGHWGRKIDVNRSVTIHAFTHFSTVSEYFAAIKNTLNIGAGMKMPDAKMYGRDVTFFFPEDSAPPFYKVTGCAADELIEFADVEYLNTVEPDFNVNMADWPDTWCIDMLDKPGENTPTQIEHEPVFPRVEDSDMDYYKYLSGGLAVGELDAGDINARTFAWGKPNAPDFPYIYPPGCSGVNGTVDIPGCIDPSMHVWYSDGDIFLEGIYEGQQLFVSQGRIHITGDFVQRNAYTVYTDEDYNLVSDPVPDVDLQNLGWGPLQNDPLDSTASKAHQAVLIARQGVVIDDYKAGWDYDGNSAELKLDAFIIVPRDSIYIHDPSDSATRNPSFRTATMSKVSGNSLNFQGAIIANMNPDFVKYFYGVANPRRYSYMKSLQSKTSPPHIPAISRVLAMFDYPEQPQFVPTPAPSAVAE